MGANAEVLATDAQPLDGAATRQYVIGPSVRTTVAPRSRYGLTVSVVKNARGLMIVRRRRAISTSEFIGIYTFWHGQLWLARTLPGYSAHPGLWAGMTCTARGRGHFVTVHQFVLGPVAQPRHWTRQDTEYVWQGPALKLYARHSRYRLPGLPPASLVGLHCGHAPAP